MPAKVTLHSLEDDREFSFQFAPVGGSTSYQSVVTEQAIRGGASIPDYSHSNPQIIRLPGEMLQDDYTDDPEERLDALIGPMWRPVPGTTRKPRVLLVGWGRRSYQGIVVSVESVSYGRLADGGRPRSLRFVVVFRADAPPAQTTGTPTIRQIGGAR